MARTCIHLKQVSKVLSARRVDTIEAYRANLVLNLLEVSVEFVSVA